LTFEGTFKFKLTNLEIEGDSDDGNSWAIDLGPKAQILKSMKVVDPEEGCKFSSSMSYLIR
jgi:hypothetical protein